jgi:cysteine-S-conjugate beta-lyase
MPHNFDTIIERRGTGSEKWAKFPPDVLPMFVADMDFHSPEPVIEALRARAEHGVFGYQTDSPELRTVIRQRLSERYAWQVEPGQILFVPGLVTGLNVVCRAFGEPGDAVLMPDPVYGPFIDAPTNNQRVRQMAVFPTTQKGQTLRYEIDFDALKEAVTPQTRVFLFCNPHNPVGRVYTRRELEQVAEFCLRHNLILCSDEIHCDLVYQPNRHIPIASLGPEIAQRSVTLMAPSKTYNLPGLGLGFAIAQNPELLQQLNEAQKGLVPLVSAMGFTAAEAAFRDGQPWLDDLMVYLKANRNALISYVETHWSEISTTCPEGTYLSWLDCRQARIPGNAYEFFLNEGKVALSDGKGYGPAGDGFVRLNFACPRSMLMDGLGRMDTALQKVGR